MLMLPVGDAAIDWGGGSVRFRGNDDQFLDADSGIAVLLTVHQGDVIDFAEFLPGTQGDLISGGATLSDHAGNINIVLTVSNAFTSGFLLNSAIPNISRDEQDTHGADAGERLYLLVWDRRTFEGKVPVVGSRFIILPFFVDGDTSMPATTYGNLPPSLPLSAVPHMNLVEAGTTVEYAPENARTMRLVSGWNLISLPLISESTSIETVFQGLVAGSIWCWETESVAGRFIEHRTIENAGGFWAFSNTGGAILVKGTDDAAGPGTLKQGWNLAGGDDRPVSSIDNVRVVWDWHAEETRFRRVGEEALLSEERGYWIYIQAN